MATAPKKKNDKKSAKKLDDGVSVGDKMEDVQQEESIATPAPEEETPVEEAPVQPPSPEAVHFEEPVLTKLIVERYEGEKVQGLYDGDGEAFFVGGHHYQGQFSQGMMHGQGQYSWASGLVYEGEFTRNKVTGRGVYRWPDGSSYEGDVVDGLRHGNGTFISDDSKMSYTGSWHMGKRHGKGRMNYDSEGMSYYEGDWVCNKRHGLGHRQYPSGNVYQGMWYNNVRHGDGTMRWLDREQMYTGNWDKGIQHGVGRHIWFLHRKAGSQYPMRNMYDGEFVRGLRHGLGTFYYANGARYEGEWQGNLKSGKGKFVFKNGRVYEGVFEKDHIMEYPSFDMNGMSTPDLSQIRTRTPLPTEQVSVHSNDSRNTYGPSFQLDVHTLLQEFTEADREEEETQVIFVIMRYMTELRRIYNFYSQLGFTESADNTFVLSRMQLWRFLKDCHLHHHDTTLADMDRVLAEERNEPLDEIHSPFTKILMREFINHLVSLAYHIYGQDHVGTNPILQWCLSKLINENILPNACQVRGHIYVETRRAENALVHIEQAYDIYKAMCRPRKQNLAESTFKMRDFLFLIKDLKLVNGDLTPKAVIDVLASDDPKVTDPDGAITLELEMTFLEFFEALVGCAQVFVTEAVVKDPTTPRPSTTLTAEQSVLSVTGSPSRGASQVGLDEGGDEGEGVTPHPAMSETGSPLPRAASEMTQKTVEGSNKLPEHTSNTTAASASEMGGRASQHTRGESPHKSAEGTLAEAKKSASYLSTRSGMTDADQVLVQSVASIGVAQSELGDKEHDEGEEVPVEEEDDLDEATRQFNFWTHQVHIFFVRKFFPAAARNLLLLQMIAQTVREEREKAAVPAVQSDASEADMSTQPAVIVEVESASHNDFAHSDIVEEQESVAES